MSGDNGNCTAIPNCGVAAINKGYRNCGFLPIVKTTNGNGKIRVGQQKTKVKTRKK